MARVEPIRDIEVIKRIKRNLSNKPRDLALFTLGINTAYRASDLLALRIRDVQGLQEGDSINPKERKTRKYRRTTLNASVIETIASYLATVEVESDDQLLFTGQRGPMTVPYVNRLVKEWCAKAGAPDLNYGSHTLRKTWGYHQRVTFNAELPLLMEAFNHSTQRQTLEYLGVQADEIKALYMNVI